MSLLLVFRVRSTRWSSKLVGNTCDQFVAVTWTHIRTKTTRYDDFMSPIPPIFIDNVRTFEPFQIVIRDCIHVLHEMISTGRSFDYVINDLTEFPVEKSLKGLNVNCGIKPGWGWMYE